MSLEDGTAKGEDYSKATAAVIIDEGETSGSGSLKVTVTGDDKSEPDETLNGHRNREGVSRSIRRSSPSWTTTPRAEATISA